MIVATQEVFWRKKKNAPKIQVKSLKMPARGPIAQSSSRLSAYNSTKNKTLTGILQKPHPDLELYLYILEKRVHLFFRKPVNDCLLKK